MRGGAYTAILDPADSCVPALRDDHGGEIHLIIRRPDTGAELRDHLRRVASKIRAHPRDCFGGNASLTAAASGVQKRDNPPPRIDEINRTAIGRINAEAHGRIGGNEPIHAGDRRRA